MTPTLTSDRQAMLAGSRQPVAGNLALRIALLRADTPPMTCGQCGKPATTKRDGAYFCGACSLGLDWQQLLQMIQDAPAPGATGEATVARSA